MTTLTISVPKPIAYFNQSLQDKLFPFLSNGEKLTLDDAIRLIDLAARGAWWCTGTGLSQNVGTIIADANKEGVDAVPFDGFEDDDPALLAVDLSINEWLSLARWSSELAELRLHDYEQAKISEMAAQSPRNWEGF